MQNRLIYIIILLFFFFNAGSTYGQGTWKRINTPTNELLRKIVFVDSSNGWAAGKNGVIIHTSNGGSNWIMENSGVTSFIIDIYFLNTNNGWALTWTETLPFKTVILKTTNGGLNWSMNDFPEDNKFINTVMFFDTLNGFLGGPGIFKTTNGGQTWVDTHIDSNLVYNLPIYNFNFYNRQFGYACGGARDNAGVVWKTTDSGDNWNAAGVGPETLYDLHFVDSSTTVGTIGDPEAIYGVAKIKTTNAGSTWKYDSLSIFGVSYALSFRTPSEGWTASGYQFLYTADTGNTWRSIITPDTVNVYDLTFPDSSVGYACGDSGIILKYDPSDINYISGRKKSSNTELFIISKLP